jgi:Holliday junction resolvase
LTTTRIETWAVPGIPDVLACDEDGLFHFIELKATGGNAVELRPHQISWLSRHARSSVWVAVQKMKTKNEPQQFFLFHGSKAMDLRFEGLKVEPDYHSVWPPNWDEVWGLISPR